MAKGKTKTKTKAKAKKSAINLRAIVLIVIGLATFGLGFIPATRIVQTNLLGKETVHITNFYNLIGNAFSDGATTEYLIMGIATLIAFISAGLMVVLGVMWMFNLLSGKEAIIALVLYGLMLIAIITYIICFYVWKADITTHEIIPGYTITTETPISTFVYFLLGLDVLGLVGHLFLHKIKI